MTPDETLAAEAHAWLVKSLEDMRAARALIDAGLPGTALFHCQQAAEKSLKAFLTWRRVPFRRTHDIEEIGTACSDAEPALGPAVKAAEPLTAYAWMLRYPGDPYVPDAGEAESALAVARGVYQEIAARLPKGPAVRRNATPD